MPFYRIVSLGCRDHAMWVTIQGTIYGNVEVIIFNLKSMLLKVRQSQNQFFKTDVSSKK